MKFKILRAVYYDGHYGDGPCIDLHLSNGKSIRVVGETVTLIESPENIVRSDTPISDVDEALGDEIQSFTLTRGEDGIPSYKDTTGEMAFLDAE